MPILLWMIPLDNILEGNSICLFKNCTGKECYGCGTTRAVFSLLHLNLRAAWDYNQMIIFIAPVLVYLYIRILIEFIRRSR